MGRQGREEGEGRVREGRKGRGPPCVSLNFPLNNLCLDDSVWGYFITAGDNECPSYYYTCPSIGFSTEPS